jgi:hypothetical protein
LGEGSELSLNHGLVLISPSTRFNFIFKPVAKTGFLFYHFLIKPLCRPVGTPKYENIFVGRNLINVQQSPCNLLQVLVNYAIVADGGESATQCFNFILTTDDYFQIKLKGLSGLGKRESKLTY